MQAEERHLTDSIIVDVLFHGSRARFVDLCRSTGVHRNSVQASLKRLTMERVISKNRDGYYSLESFDAAKDFLEYYKKSDSPRKTDLSRRKRRTARQAKYFLSEFDKALDDSLWRHIMASRDHEFFRAWGDELELAIHSGLVNMQVNEIFVHIRRKLVQAELEDVTLYAKRILPAKYKRQSKEENASGSLYA